MLNVKVEEVVDMEKCVKTLVKTNKARGDQGVVNSFRRRHF